MLLIGLLMAKLYCYVKNSIVVVFYCNAMLWINVEVLINLTFLLQAKYTLFAITLDFF